MVWIRRADVPEYLRRGDWFEALDPEDTGAFEVPAACFKVDDNVQTKEDLHFLLRSIQYWQVQDIPLSAIAFIYLSEPGYVGDEFPVFRSRLQNLRTVKEANPKNRLSVALKMDFRWEMIRWLHENAACELCTEACGAAAAVGDSQSLAYLHGCGCPWDSNTVKESIVSGNIACWEYARAHSCPLLSNETSSISLAARNGRLNMIKHLRNSGEQWDVSTMNEAVLGSSVASLRYLHEAGCPWDDTVCMNAAAVGSLACLQFAHENGCPWGADAPAHAAERGHLSCLQYLHEQQCPWDAHVTYNAAKGGHLECLKYAHKYGCNWHEKITCAAFCKGHWHCAWYAMRHGAKYGLTAAFAFALILWIATTLFLWYLVFCVLTGGVTERKHLSDLIIRWCQVCLLVTNIVRDDVSAELQISSANLKRLQRAEFSILIVTIVDLVFTMYPTAYHRNWMWGEGDALW